MDEENRTPKTNQNSVSNQAKNFAKEKAKEQLKKMAMKKHPGVPFIFVGR